MSTQTPMTKTQLKELKTETYDALVALETAVRSFDLATRPKREAEEEDHECEEEEEDHECEEEDCPKCRRGLYCDCMGDRCPYCARK
jgi:ribosomal protein L12E/L44/L45/RPP1/RPP2